MFKTNAPPWLCIGQLMVRGNMAYQKKSQWLVDGKRKGGWLEETLWWSVEKEPKQQKLTWSIITKYAADTLMQVFIYYLGIKSTKYAADTH